VYNQWLWGATEKYAEEILSLSLSQDSRINQIAHVDSDDEVEREEDRGEGQILKAAVSHETHHGSGSGGWNPESPFKT
jgi:hypothetical protein